MILFDMIGKLLPLIGLGGTSLCCMFFGHKYRKKQSSAKMEHGCPDCGGQGYYYYEPESGPSFHKLCLTCKGTKVDPSNPLPLPERKRRGQEGRNRRKDVDPLDKTRDRLKWKKQGHKVKVIMPYCVRCGEKNPNWNFPNDEKPSGLFSVIFGWLLSKLTN